MSKTVNYPLPIQGVDMLSAETALGAGTVRSAINVDIGRAGRFARRTGLTNKLAGSGYHSLWYAPQKGITLVAKDDVLYKLDTVSYSLTQLYQLNSSHSLDYCEYNGNLYFSNRETLGWVPSNSTLARKVGVDTPPAPTLAVSNSGTLLPGKYYMSVTIVDDRGEEGPGCPVQQITLPSGGGIILSGLPVQLGLTIFVYMTEADGDVLRRVAGFPASFDTYALVERDIEGSMEREKIFLTQLPPGDFVRWLAGRLYTASNGELRFSEAHRPHLYDPAHGRIPFSGNIAFIEPVIDGIYVGDSRGVWFLSGTDPTKFELRRVSTHRAVPRSSVLLPPEHFNPKKVETNDPVALWLSTAGYIVGEPGGNVIELHSDKIRLPFGMSGRSTFLLRNGRKQIVTPVNSTTTADNGVAGNAPIQTYKGG